MARPRKAKNSAAKAWKYQKGEPPNTVTAYERLSRGRTVEVRWWLGETKKFRTRSLGFGIRDERGAIDPELEQEAVRQTQAIYDSLRSGRGLPVDEGDDSGPLSLEAGFEIATTVPTGMYVVESEHLREVRRAARDIVQAIGTNRAGRARPWDSLTYSVVRELWLRLAQRYARTGQGGPVWTERCVVILLQVAQWLAVEERIERLVVVRKTWRDQMRREWEQLTGDRIARSTPRHSEEEIRRIFASLDHPRTDPRIALALELGAEARLGQVIRMMRSDIDLSEVGAFGLGRVIVHGAGKKLGVTRDLTPEERAAIDRAIAGYLRDLENSFQSGLRDDYPIFPAGRLKYDIPPSRQPRRSRVGRSDSPSPRRAKTTVSDQPIGKSALTGLFHSLERIARVEPVLGRGWYGIRRKATDVYEDYETDERVLNDQTGHRSSETRREVYQEKEREEVRARSAATRRRVRSAAFGRPLHPAQPSDEETPMEDSEVESDNDSDAPPRGAKTGST